MKLLLLVKQIEGGTGTYIRDLCRLRDINTTPLSLSVVILEKPAYIQYSIQNVSVHYFSNEERYPSYYTLTLYNLKRYLRELLWLFKIVSEEKPDIILSVDTHCNILASFTKLLRFNQLKIIHTIHNNLSAVTFHRLSPATRRMVRFVCGIISSNANSVVAVSRGAADDYCHFFHINHPPIVIYHGVELPKHVLQKNKPPHVVRLLSVGRFALQKDFETIIEACAILAKHNNPFSLTLVGDGYKKENLISLVEKNGLYSHVTFVGWCKDVSKYFKQSDVFILSSHYEGFSYVLIEAMSYGLPVISTDTPYGPSEILENGKYGIMIPMGNSLKMAEAIENIIANKTNYKRYSQKSIIRSKDFSLRTMLSQYHDLLLKMQTPSFVHGR